MNKEDILNQVTQQEIFFRFLNLIEFPKGNISSPFSKDSNPSFTLYKNNTFKCQSNGNQGDAFQLVADLNNLNCSSQFHEVLKIIQDEFNLIEDTKKLTYETKAFDSENIKFWKQGNWNVSEDILKKYAVLSLSEFTFYNKSKEKDTTTNCNNLNAYAYKLNNEVEIYIPSQKNRTKKFVINKTKGTDIFGLKQITKKVKYIVISAGKKDCLVLNANGIPSVCFRSENHKPTIKQIDEIKSKCDFIFICYDNDIAGQKFMNKISEEFDIRKLTIPEKFNDIADYFLENDSEKIKNSLNELVAVEEANLKQNTTNTVFHEAEEYLNDRYSFRFNNILLDIEICKKGYDKWEQVNENNLYVELQKTGVKISANNLIALLKTDQFVGNYNPIKQYFESIPAWDNNHDYITEFASYVQAIDKDQYIYHFKKWCVRVVKCALIGNYFNKQAFILVQRGQNTGKSTYCRFLTPPTLRSYIAEDFKADKDSRILLCKNLLINLDELAGLDKNEINNLKSMFSKEQINERLPYDRRNSILPRISSFIGSTNEESFLRDETGSVRWLCFQITNIDWNYKSNFNIDNLWAQAYALAESDFDETLSRQDIEENEQRNQKFQQLSLEQELISKYFGKADKDSGIFMTASEVIVYLVPLKQKLYPGSVGKAITALGHIRVKDIKTQRYGYFLNPLPLTDTDSLRSFDDVKKVNIENNNSKNS